MLGCVCGVRLILLSTFQRFILHSAQGYPNPNHPLQSLLHPAPHPCDHWKASGPELHGVNCCMSWSPDACPSTAACTSARKENMPHWRQNRITTNTVNLKGTGSCRTLCPPSLLSPIAADTLNACHSYGKQALSNKLAHAACSLGEDVPNTNVSQTSSTSSCQQYILTSTPFDHPDQKH